FFSKFLIFSNISIYLSAKVKVLLLSRVKTLLNFLLSRILFLPGENHFKRTSALAAFLLCDRRILAMALNKVEICGVNTSRLPILTNDEKEVLFERIKQGDMEAREQYIKGNLRLVLSVIKRFSSSSENPDDLFQIGCIGLIKAIDNFDTTLNVKFSTYAVPMIIGEIRRYLRDNNSIRVSRSLRDTAYKAIYAKENYVKQNSKEPTVMEISKEIGIEKEMIVYALDAIQSPVSLYEPVYTEGGDTLYVM